MVISKIYIYTVHWACNSYIKFTFLLDLIMSFMLKLYYKEKVRTSRQALLTNTFFTVNKKSPKEFVKIQKHEFLLIDYYTLYNYDTVIIKF